MNRHIYELSRQTPLWVEMLVNRICQNVLTLLAKHIQLLERYRRPQTCCLLQGVQRTQSVSPSNFSSRGKQKADLQSNSYMYMCKQEGLYLTCMPTLLRFCMVNALYSRYVLSTKSKEKLLHLKFWIMYCMQISYFIAEHPHYQTKIFHKCNYMSMKIKNKSIIKALYIELWVIVM